MFLQEVVVRLHHTNITNSWFFFFWTQSFFIRKILTFFWRCYINHIRAYDASHPELWMMMSPPRIHAPKSLFLKEIRVSMIAATRGWLGSAFWCGRNLKKHASKYACFLWLSIEYIHYLSSFTFTTISNLICLLHMLSSCRSMHKTTHTHAQKHKMHFINLTFGGLWVTHGSDTHVITL